jgi:NAD(P)H-dependent FMN reductase
MKSLIIYYSYSGNTKKVAGYLREYLGQRGQADIAELKAPDETNSFLGQCRRAFLRKRARIEPLNYDPGKYDLICLGAPVWAFAPPPAMNTYLDQVQNIQGKEVVLFTTYGSGTGNNRCLNYMRRLLMKKGAESFRRFSLQQVKVNDRDFVMARIGAILS